MAQGRLYRNMKNYFYEWVSARSTRNYSRNYIYCQPIYVLVYYTASSQIFVPLFLTVTSYAPYQPYLDLWISNLCFKLSSLPKTSSISLLRLYSAPRSHWLIFIGSYLSTSCLQKLRHTWSHVLKAQKGDQKLYYKFWFNFFREKFIYQ